MNSKFIGISSLFFTLQAHALVGSLIDYKSIDRKAIGSVGLDTSSFLYRSKARDTSATTFEASLGGEFDSKVLHGEGQGDFYTFVNDKPQLGFEAKNLYVSTQNKLIPNQQLTLGRRHYEWSKVDSAWTMMSLYSPRFVWDQIYPQSIGMTGAFYTFRTKRFKAMAFASPIAIPERGTPLTEENHNITSPNPFWNPLPTELPIQGNPTKIEYTLLMPAMQEILLRPNFAVRGEYDWESGFWVSGNLGILPVNMTQLAAEPYLDSSSSGGALSVNIRPQFPMRNIYTAEFGYNDPGKQWSAWGSMSYEHPFHFENQDNWLNPIITPTTVLSAGTEFKFTQNFSFYGGLLFVHEQPFVRSSSLPEINVELPSRYPLKQGIKAGGKWIFSDVNEASVTWIQDLVQSAHFVGADVQHKFRSLNLSIGGGMDLMLANDTKGWVGQYYGDDRIRGWLKYAF